ncbi:MAG: response regulator [Desulfuromonas thiophila]|nr:response regulator [Desulfuromonas thiophila]
MEGEAIVILLAEDEPAHAEIVRRTLEQSRIANRLIHVSDGQQALDYLYRRPPFAEPQQAPRPGLILLDLRMPRVDGLEVLERVKSDPALAGIPVVVLTTSAAETDLLQAYDRHANSYVVKPVDFAKFTALMETLGYYWLIWNRLPQGDPPA